MLYIYIFGNGGNNIKNTGDDGKEILNYIKECHIVSRLFTQESVLVTVYNEAKKHKVNGSFMSWIEDKIDIIEKEKIKFTKRKLNYPLETILDNLSNLKLNL